MHEFEGKYCYDVINWLIEATLLWRDQIMSFQYRSKLKWSSHNKKKEQRAIMKTGLKYHHQTKGVRSIDNITHRIVIMHQHCHWKWNENLLVHWRVVRQYRILKNSTECSSSNIHPHIRHIWRPTLSNQWMCIVMNSRHIDNN